MSTETCDSSLITKVCLYLPRCLPTFGKNVYSKNHSVPCPPSGHRFYQCGTVIWQKYWVRELVLGTEHQLYICCKSDLPRRHNCVDTFSLCSAPLMWCNWNISFFMFSSYSFRCGVSFWQSLDQICWNLRELLCHGEKHWTHAILPSPWNGKC